MMREIREEMTKTVLGEVLADLLEARDMPAAIDYVEVLVDPTNIDGEKLLRRIEDASAEHPGDLGEMADRLELSRQERHELAFALAYEMRAHKTPEIPELSPEQEECLQSRIRSLDAINTAIATVEDNPQPNERVQVETLDELGALAEEARMEVDATKREYGFAGY